ncbi:MULTISPECIES: hypothetical protein [unclassified Pseudomonas]|uniref:hypothetical protein n=1 Tax=unclassified Pseudomonas TaxID=196821 RepID=UPI0011AEE312|nr:MULTISPECIES: hypothetical protein [unclassified Pseudomonas]
MPAGLQILNASGTLQIDECFKSMVLTQKGTVVLNRPNFTGINPYQQAAYATINYPVSARQPVLALRSPVNVCYLTTDTGFNVFGLPNHVGATVEYFIFDQVEFGVRPGNVGLQVWGSAGTEVFNSNNNYMKVLSSYSVDLVVSDVGNPPTVPTYSGSAPSGRKLAVCMGVQSTGHFIQGVGTSAQPVAIIRYWQCQCITPTDNTFTLSNRVIQQFGGPITARPGSSGAISPFNSGLILDVTGY